MGSTEDKIQEKTMDKNKKTSENKSGTDSTETEKSEKKKKEKKRGESLETFWSWIQHKTKVKR